MVRDSARKYAREKLLPRVIKAYNDETFDIKIMREMGELGFLGCTISDYDLPGVSSVAYGIITLIYFTFRTHQQRSRSCR